MMARRLTLSLLVLLFQTFSATAFAPAPVYRERVKSDEGDLKRMQGTWRGQDLDLDLVVSNGRISAFNYNRFMGWHQMEWALVLDETKSPKVIEFKEKGTNGVMRGIYRLEGDTLTLRHLTSTEC